MFKQIYIYEIHKVPQLSSIFFFFFLNCVLTVRNLFLPVNLYNVYAS